MFTSLIKAFPLKKCVLSKLVVSLAKALWGIYLFLLLGVSEIWKIFGQLLSVQNFFGG